MPGTKDLNTCLPRAYHDTNIKKLCSSFVYVILRHLGNKCYRNMKEEMTTKTRLARKWVIKSLRYIWNGVFHIGTKVGRTLYFLKYSFQSIKHNARYRGSELTHFDIEESNDQEFGINTVMWQRVTCDGHVMRIKKNLTFNAEQTKGSLAKVSVEQIQR